jgi:hypothetical protein
MRTALRLVGYAAVLALAFGAAWSLGTAVGTPVWTTAGPGPAPPPGPTAPPLPPRPPVDPDPLGLAASAAGYTLVLPTTTFVPGQAGELAFAVTGSDGRPVRTFDARNELPMHVIVVRRDAAGYLHLQPTLGPDGLWRVPLVLPAPGIYRLYTDFVPTGGPALVLGTDLFAAGKFVPVPFGPNRVAQIDGYQVRLDGDLVAGRPSQVFATVSRNGAAVTDLQPYLGAFGHLVALRRNDLGYVHVPPDALPPAPTDRSGPGIAFTALLPTPGSYRLFLEFRHGPGVHIAEFTVDTRDGA